MTLVLRLVYWLFGARGCVIANIPRDLILVTRAYALLRWHLIVGWLFRVEYPELSAQRREVRRLAARVRVRWRPRTSAGGFAYWRQTGLLAPIGGGAESPTVPIVNAPGTGFASDISTILSRVRARVIDVLDRPGVLADGVADCTTGLQEAYTAATAAGGAVVYHHIGDYKTTSALTAGNGVWMDGAGYLTSRIMPVGAIRGIVYEPGTQQESNITLSNIGVVGETANSLDLIAFKNLSGTLLLNIGARNTQGDCVQLDACYKTTIISGRVEDFEGYGINAIGTCNIATLIANDFNANTATGVGCLHISGGQWTIVGGNWEGFSLTSAGARLDGTQGLRIMGIFAEGLLGSAIFSENTTVCLGVVIEGCNIATNAGQQIDFSTGNLAHRVEIRRNHFPACDASTDIFSPGTASSFEFVENTRDPDLGDWVTGFTGPDVIRRNGTVWVNSVPIEAYGTTLSGATPDVSDGTLFDVTNGGATTMTSMTGITGQRVTLRFTNGNTTVQNGGSPGFRLAGAVNFVATSNDMLTLVNVGGNTWIESGRSVN